VEGCLIDVQKPDRFVDTESQELARLRAELSAADPLLELLPPSAKVYCVGGAVRDGLSGNASVDRDFVVVGATPESMVKAGFKPVGSDFPVFLHPVTHNEYALARTERKTGRGYKGFVFNADPSVSLEEDLIRRDLTVNAIALSRGGELIDPFHGISDLRAGLLRHIGPAFAEDPVRVLRLARFAARWPEVEVAAETLVLCRSMVDHGEVTALVAERVWQELAKGLVESSPSRMIHVLQSCHAWQELHPRLASVSKATCQALDRAAMLRAPLDVAYALLIHNTEGSPQPADVFKAPKSCIDLAQQVLAKSDTVERVITMMDHSPRQSVAPIFDWLMGCDVQRRYDRFDLMLTVFALEGRLSEAHHQRLRDLGSWLTTEQANQAAAQAAEEALHDGRSNVGGAVAVAVREARFALFRTHPLFKA
jgi:tRNA nucleotidyltransferase (CCA-adding enzyme)